MTDATATFYDVAPFDGRVSRVGDCRPLLRGVVIGLGSVAAACALITSVTAAAVWIVSIALSANPNTNARATMGPATLALAQYSMAPARAPVISGPAPFSTGRADGPDAGFEAKWARATASGPAGAAPLVSLEPAHNVPSPQADLDVAAAAVSTYVAELNPASTPASPLSTPPTPEFTTANTVPLPKPNPARHETTRSPVGEAAPQVAMAMPSSAADKRALGLQTSSTLLPGPDSRIAVYDIGAHTVHLPNGQKLEAHSGLGDKLDDARYIKVKNRGPTPPNVYDLTLREALFHGVRAIRLNPVREDDMFGRDGMLAHTYMLGPNGDSNGCVSFKDYPAFLRAVLRNEVDRLVVVATLRDLPSRIARARRERDPQYAFAD
jgi:hypothetical protein